MKNVKRAKSLPLTLAESGVSFSMRLCGAHLSRRYKDELDEDGNPKIAMRAYYRKYALFSLLMLCYVPVCLAQGSIDTGTQRNGMHSCPVGRFVMGAQKAKNLLLCGPLPGNFGAEVVDKDTQEQGMHACPAGMAMTGLQAKKNLLACAPLTNPPPSRFVDSSTQDLGMHACPGGVAAAGINVDRNLLLCAGLQTAETEDASTQRNDMHSCPLGRFVSGVQVGRNLLLCTTAPLETPSEIVDSGTQSHGMHACPEGYVMTGIQVSKNQLACTHLNAPLIPRIVDVGGPHNLGTQRQGMHACPPGQPLSGIHVAKNLNLCGDRYVVRVNSLIIDPNPIQLNVPFLVSWNVTCTDPACTVTLADKGALSWSKVLPVNQYIGSLSQTISSNQIVASTYTVSATAGGGTDTQSQTTAFSGSGGGTSTPSLSANVGELPQNPSNFGLRIQGNNFGANETVEVIVDWIVSATSAAFPLTAQTDAVGYFQVWFSGVTPDGFCPYTVAEGQPQPPQNFNVSATVTSHTKASAAAGPFTCP